MNLWDFICVKMTNILIPKKSVLASAGRPDRSTALEVGRPGGRPTCTDVHAILHWRSGRPSRELCSLEMPRSTGPVDRQRALLSVPEARSADRPTAAPTVRKMIVGGRPGGRPDREPALCIQATVDRPVDRWPNGQKSDRWPVSRAVDRQLILAPNS